MAHKTSKLGVGMLLGAVAGAVAGLFLAPKAGKEMREEAMKIYKRLQNEDPKAVAKDVFGDISEESQKVIKQVYEDLSVEIADLKDKYDTIDKAKYEAAVKSVVKSVKDEGNVPEASLKKLGAYLQGDVKKLVARPAAKKKVAAVAKKKAPVKKAAVKKVAKKAAPKAKKA